MDYYRSKRTISAGAIFFIVFFILVFIGMGYLFYIDQGIFWDYSFYICIPSLVINLILIIFYFIKRSVSGYIFLLFFLIFLVIVTLASFFGPFALINSARNNYDKKQYDNAIMDFEKILEQYPGSRHAPEAMRNIAYASYSGGKYKDAISYFQKAIEDEVVDGDSLEVKKILSDSNLKLAENYYDKDEYERSAKYYIDSVKYFKEILEDFPDTNEAFIASYKIPEYLYTAASSLSRAGLREESNEILVGIIEDFPENEYSEKAGDLLFFNILNISKDLKNDGNYNKSAREFIKIFDLEDELIKERQYEIRYYKDYIFKNIPLTILIEIANEMYFSIEYKKALFIYEYILENHPDYESMIVKNMVETKIMLTRQNKYEVIEDIQPSGSFSGEGISKITFVNKTDNGLIIFMGGPEYRIIDLEKESESDIEIKSGTYRIVSESEDPVAATIYLKTDFQEGKRYRQIFESKEEDSPNDS